MLLLGLAHAFRKLLSVLGWDVLNYQNRDPASLSLLRTVRKRANIPSSRVRVLKQPAAILSAWPPWASSQDYGNLGGFR